MSGRNLIVAVEGYSARFTFARVKISVLAPQGYRDVVGVHGSPALDRRSCPRESAPAEFEMPEILWPVEKAVGCEPDVVAVDGVDAGLRIETHVRRIESGDSAESAERNRDRHARRKHLVEILPVVVEERIRVHVVRREYLSERVLKVMVE